MENLLTSIDKATLRQFIPSDFTITTWDALKPYFDEILAISPANGVEMEEFLLRRNELESVLDEEFAWRYIRMTCDTASEEKQERYQDMVANILPHLAPIDDEINRKLAANPFFKELPEKPYLNFQQGIIRQIELFRTENIPLFTEDRTISRDHGNLMGAMTIEHDGKTLTLQQAGKFMEEKDRNLRQEVWQKMVNRRLTDKDNVDEVIEKLIPIRHQVALNAGYSNYTAYKFDELGRFDYTQAEVEAFHEAVEKEVKPVYERLLEHRRQTLGIERLRPWDLSVDVFGDKPLHPFSDADDLLHKTIDSLRNLRPELGEMIALMDREGFLDLESRVGKAPGGYNYPLMESGIPFIFMNAAGTHNDVITLFHESGHAIHSFVTREIKLNALKSVPSEVAELASMSMELMTMDQYYHFYPEEQDNRRAVMTQLEHCMTGLPWIATVDAFQAWLYNNPNHTREERSLAWTQTYERFHGDQVDWSGFEVVRENLWQRQGHIFDVPFYYIEYGIAQLGAIAVWRNFKLNPEKGLQQYLDALSLGYTASMPEIYHAAGIRFDFSPDYIGQSMRFVLQEFEALANA